MHTARFAQLNCLNDRHSETLSARQDWGQPGSGSWQTGGGIDTSGYTYFAGSNYYGPVGYDHGRRAEVSEYVRVLSTSHSAQLNALHSRRSPSDETLAARQDWGQPGSGDWQTGGGIDTSGYTYFAGSNYYGPVGYDHGRRGEALNVQCVHRTMFTLLITNATDSSQGLT